MKERVLIVDDDEDVRRILCLRLERAGFEVGGAAGGTEALAALTEEQWDLVVLDLVMPQVDGFEVLAQLRQLATGPPVIAITQFDDLENQKRALDLGARCYLSKGRAFGRDFIGSIRQCLGAAD